MNSPFIVDQSKRIADRASQRAGDNQAAAIRQCFQLLLNRDPTAAETQWCTQVVETEGLHVVCRALINSNEFAFLP